MAVNHYFKVFSNDGSTTLFTSANTVDGSTIITVTETGLTIGTETYTYSGTKKFVGVSFSENSTSPELAIGESFDGNTAYAYIVEAEPTTSGVTVEYNGSVVATIPNGNKATIPIADKKMKTDIVITVPKAEGGTDSPLPTEVSTEAEMTALLTSGEVGGVYKYMGTTGTYENGVLYLLEEEAETEDELAGTWVLNNTVGLLNTISVNFESDGQDFVSIDANSEFITYGTSDDVVYAMAEGNWVNQAYKTITITSKLNEVTNGDTLLTWLKANATKQ